MDNYSDWKQNFISEEDNNVDHEINYFSEREQTENQSLAKELSKSFKVEISDTLNVVKMLELPELQYLKREEEKKVKLMISWT